MTPSQKERYARHLLLPGFGEASQERLLKSRVLLIGAGGLGSPCALYLVAAGVGHLTIVDHDTVDVSNLQRQILHSEKSVKVKKTKSAKERLADLNSEVQVDLVEEALSVVNARELVRSHDLVIDGSDNFPTRFLVNDACYFEKKPLVYGSIFQYEGQLTFFNTSAGGPCYRCLVPSVPEEGAVPNCLEAGVIGTLPGIIGSFQAMEAIKFLAGVGEPPIGKMLYYEALVTTVRSIQLLKDPQCPLCSPESTIDTLHSELDTNCDLDTVESISARELRSLLSEGEVFLIDVREPEEFAQVRIPSSHLIPLQTLRECCEALPRGEKIYVHCKSGARSKRAIQVLKERGFTELVDVSDGIDAWLRE